MEKREVNDQSSMVVTPNQFSEDVLNSLYAQILLKYSLYKGEKQRLLKAIDGSLERKDRINFYSKTNQYLDFLNQYEEGILLYENGLEFRVYFEGENHIKMN
jgi:uncharacterized protein YpiB (UPF0302 family)